MSSKQDPEGSAMWRRERFFDAASIVALLAVLVGWLLLTINLMRAGM